MSKEFNDWTLICNKKNRGTVHNLNSGLEVCKGRFTKLISPGDALIKNSILKNWMEFLIESNSKWSFSDAVYYKNKNCIISNAHPNDIKPYLKGNKKMCRWNYIALNDIALGAAIFSETALLKKYVLEIVDKIIYAEDNVWRIMMFDGIVGSYYPEATIFYEFGTGVSTNENDIWKQRLKDDWNSANKLMLSSRNLNQFQKSLIKAWKLDSIECNWLKLFIRGKIKNYIKKKFKARKTYVFFKEI